MQTDKQMIEELHKKDKTASIVNDLPALLSLWADDAVALPPSEDPIIGKDAIKAWLESGLNQEQNYEITKYEQNFEETQIIGEWVFEWGVYSCTAKPKSEGLPISTTGKLLRILKRQKDGSWKVSRSIWNNDPSSNEAVY